MSESEMSLIASGNLDNNLISDRTKTQLKTFLIAQAKAELVRVVKLTETLDKLQDKLQDKMMEYIDNHDDQSAVMYLPGFIDVMTKCLDRSNDIIKQVIGDDKMLSMLFVDASTNISSVSNQINTMSTLEDPMLRNNVREAVKSILNTIEAEQVK